MSALQPISNPSFGAVSRVLPPSLAAGGDSKLMLQSLFAMARLPPSASGDAQAASRITERLFNVSAGLKISVSQVSMHLPDEWRRKLFRKIDQLHNADDWEPTDILLQQDSFMSFLRLILQIGPVDRMSLGISEDGHLLAGWTKADDALTLEFAGPDEVRWTVVRHIDGHRESAAGRTRRERLAAVLRPYSPENWLKNAPPISA